jgi:hypothetical protein
VLWLFVAFYGYSMVISDEGMDANRYRDIFIALAHDNNVTQNFIGTLYTEDTSYVDAIQPLITYIVSRFTDNPRILFAVFGLIFGFFYSRNIWFMLEHSDNEIKFSSFIYAFVFAITIGFWEINGFRMWTAAHVFFFGTIHYLIDNKKTSILIASTSIFFHFSFLLPVVLLFIFIVLPKRISWFYIFFISTFFLSLIEISAVSSKLTNFLPGFFHSKIEGYTSDAYIEAVAGEQLIRNWRYHLYQQSVKWVVTGFISVLFFYGRSFFYRNQNYNLLFCFAMFIMSSINIVSNIPSISRFYSVAYLFVFALIFLYLQNAPDFRLKKLALTLSFPFLIFYCLGMINISFLTIGLTTLVGNPIIALLSNLDFDFAIIELLK